MEEEEHAFLYFVEAMQHQDAARPVTRSRSVATRSGRVPAARSTVTRSRSPAARSGATRSRSGAARTAPGAGALAEAGAGAPDPTPAPATDLVAPSTRVTLRYLPLVPADEATGFEEVYADVTTFNNGLVDMMIACDGLLRKAKGLLNCCDNAWKLY
jgi:hypothetical protein